MSVARERSGLVPLKAMATSRPTPLENAAIETPAVITVDVLRSVSTMLMVVLNRFIFLATRSRTSGSPSKYASVSVSFLGDMFVNVFCYGVCSFL